MCFYDEGRFRDGFQHNNIQAALEVRHSLRSEKNNFFLSYLLRNVLAQLVAMLFMAFLVVAVARNIFSNSDTIKCNVHNKYQYTYECSGIPRSFYMYIVICGES